MKLKRQIAQFGSSSTGMPPIVVYVGTDGELVIFDGITRATRIAQLSPGSLVTVEIAGKVKRAVGRLPKIGDSVP